MPCTDCLYSEHCILHSNLCLTSKFCSGSEISFGTFHNVLELNSQLSASNIQLSNFSLQLMLLAYIHPPSAFQQNLYMRLHAQRKWTNGNQSHLLKWCTLTSKYFLAKPFSYCFGSELIYLKALETLKSETNKTCQQDTDLVTAALLKGECWYKRIIHILLNHQKMYTSV